MTAKDLRSSTVSIQEAAKALDVQRQAIQGRIKSGSLVPVEGSRPIQLERSAIAEEAQAKLEQARKHVQALERGVASLGVSQDEVTQADVKGWHAEAGSSTDRSEATSLREELSQATVGRALAEAKIDELKAAVRRLNAAVDALKPQPDFDPDEVT